METQSPTGETVILIHGLWANALSLAFIARHLKKSGFRVRYFKYPSMRHSLEQNSALLHQQIQDLDVSRCHLVGHSLGGMIALQYLQNYSAKNIGRVILMGSPVNGSKVARALTERKFLSGVLGHCVEPLCQGLEYTGKHPVAVIAGKGGLGFGRLVTRIESPHDGAVMVREALLNNCADSVVLPTSHFSMLLSPRVVRNVVEYLSAGKFLEADQGNH